MRVAAWDGITDPSWCTAVELMIDFHQPEPPCLGRYICFDPQNCLGKDDCPVYIPDEPDDTVPPLSDCEDGTCTIGVSNDIPIAVMRQEESLR